MTTKKKRAPSAKTPASKRLRATPTFVTPMAAQVVKELPEGDDWIYELKFDGYRALVIKDEQQVELRSRKNKDLTGMYPGLAAAGSRLDADQAVMDGEIVALDGQGSPVRAGFVPHLRRDVFKELKPHHVDDCPFVDLPNPKASRWGGGVTADEMREMQWVTPELVAQIRFAEWTAEGRLRHAAFLGMRADKSAREVRREWRGL